MAKETATGKTGSSSWSWFSKSTQSQAEEWSKEFKSKMRELAWLYARREQTSVPMIEAKSSEATVEEAVVLRENEDKTLETVTAIVVEEDVSTVAAAVETSEEGNDGSKKQERGSEPAMSLSPAIEDEKSVAGVDEDNLVSGVRPNESEEH